ncbi:unnamed protein product [marine sediment metagenome]|uniref:Replication protein n=1 Tax=marine sediment metagenome TaxID=412755 RepID=X1KFJ0_9ZZZZ
MRKFQKGVNAQKCGIVPISNTIDIRIKNGHAFSSGLVVCANPACPVCAHRIAIKHGEELKIIIAGVVKDGGDVLMGTFTFPHDYGDALAPALKMMSLAYGKIISGRPARRLLKKIGLIASVRVIEVTIGPNGFHPHFHVLYFFDHRLTEAERSLLSDFLYERWADQVVDAGYRQPSPERGLTLSHGENAAHYISKIASEGLADELSKSENKTGRKGSRSFYQLIDDFKKYHRDADARYLAEYSEGLYRKKRQVWSGQNLRNKYLGQVKSDLELAQEAEEEEFERAETIIKIERPDWSRMIKIDPANEERIYLIAEIRGRAGVIEFLNSIFRGHARPPP